MRRWRESFAACGIPGVTTGSYGSSGPKTGRFRSVEALHVPALLRHSLEHGTAEEKQGQAWRRPEVTSAACIVAEPGKLNLPPLGTVRECAMLVESEHPPVGGEM